MDMFRVESIHFSTTPEKAFAYVADPRHLPDWTNAFKSVENGRAVMATPAGTVEVDLLVKASASEGTIDWHITFPDGSVAFAYSRILPDSTGQAVYCFVLMAPPVPLEKLEGALDQQAAILRKELTKLSAIVRET